MPYRSVVFVICVTLAVTAPVTMAQKAKPSPISTYLLSKQYSPSPTHDSRWVPGGLIKVNWSTGIYDYVRPLGSFKPLSVSDSTQQLDKDFNANAQGAGAAASAMTDLLGKIGIKLTGEGDDTFSGVEFTTKSLDADEPTIKKILANKADDTYTYLADKTDGLLRDSYDVYLIEEVEYATSVSMKANKTFSISGGVNVDPSADTCKLPDLPQFDPPKVGDAAAIPADGQTGDKPGIPAADGQNMGQKPGTASRPAKGDPSNNTQAGSGKTADSEQKKADPMAARAVDQINLEDLSFTLAVPRAKRCSGTPNRHQRR